METEPLQEVTKATDNDLKPKTTRKRDTALFLIIVLTGSMTCLLNGLVFVWPSSAIPKMKSNHTEVNPVGRPITTFETSMLAGLPSLAMLLGSIVHGYLSEVVGRRGSLQIASIGIFISITPLAFSTSIIYIITFRCFWFFFCHGGMTVYLVYLTEICEDHNRAKYGCFAGAFFPFGNLIGYGLGAFLNFRNFTLAGLSPIIILPIFFFFAPESPYYSLSKGKTEECARALQRLRRHKSGKELESDLRSISDTINAAQIQTKRNNIPLVNLFNNKERRYALMLAILPIMIKVFCGIGIILPFMEPIFIAAGTKFNSSHMPVAVAVFKFLAFFLTSFLVEKCGRRILLLISSAGSGLPLFVFGCFFYLKYIESPLIHQLQWLPLACTIFYVSLFSFGMASIPQATMGEFFTPEVRATGVSFITTFFAIFLFCSSATYPYIVENLGLHWCLWMYSILSLLGVALIYLIIPENKGKSFIEIQEYIQSRCNNK